MSADQNSMPRELEIVSIDHYSDARLPEASDRQGNIFLVHQWNEHGVILGDCVEIDDIYHESWYQYDFPKAYPFMLKNGRLAELSESETREQELEFTE